MYSHDSNDKGNKKNKVFRFFAKVSVVEHNLLFHNLIATDTWYRWGVGRSS